MNKKHCKHLAIATLGLSLGFASCSKDEPREAQGLRPTPPTEEVENALEKLDLPRVRLDLEAELESLSEARSLDYKLVDRSDRRTDGKSYPDEYSSELNLQVGDHVSVYTVLYRSGATLPNGKPIVIRTWLPFEVISSADARPENRGRKNIIRYVGDVYLPAQYANYSFEKDHTGNQGDNWYIMGILNYTTARRDIATGSTYHGRKDDDKSASLTTEKADEWNRLSQGSSVAKAEAGAEMHLGSAPYVAKWKPLKITQGKRNGQVAYIGGQFGLEFKPQGVLIQVDLGANTSQAYDIRRFGMVSNVLDFSGKYNLDDAHIVSSFQNDELPLWEPDEPKVFDYSMYYLPEANSPISSGTRFFPWEQPTLSLVGNGTWDASKYSTAKELSLPSGTVRETHSLGILMGTRSYSYSYLNGNSSTKLSQSFSHAWQFSPVGGNYGTKIIHTIWAMPRDNSKITGDPYTYYWTSAYAADYPTAEDIFNKNFNPQEKMIRQYNILADLRKTVIDYDESIRQLKEALATMTSSTARAQTEASIARLEQEKNNFIASNGIAQKAAQFSTDSTLYYGTLQPEYLNQITARTQPFLVLYQTKQKFDQRKATIVHVQTTIETDLMFSEVTYKKGSDGKNYSFVAIQNPSLSPKALKDYAIARLIPSGGHLSYRKADGTATDNLSEALILPLSISAMKQAGAQDPFASGTTEFTSWSSSTRGSYDNPSTRFFGIKGSNARWSTSNKGPYQGYTRQSNLQLFDNNWTISPNYGLILGASGYAIDQAVPSDFATLNANFTGNDLRVSSFSAFADGASKASGGFDEGTLDYSPGDAFVLLKSNGAGGWQIIDATGPIGAEGLGFAGSYADYKAQFDAMAGKSHFSMQRLHGVSFPFLAPYRTKRINPTKWADDWDLTDDITKFQFGYTTEFPISVWKFPYTRTPLDKSYSTYRDNIPNHLFK